MNQQSPKFKLLGKGIGMILYLICTRARGANECTVLIIPLAEI
jgi:hypothetical protein